MSAVRSEISNQYLSIYFIVLSQSVSGSRFPYHHSDSQPLRVVRDYDELVEHRGRMQWIMAYPDGHRASHHWRTHTRRAERRLVAWPQWSALDKQVTAARIINSGEPSRSTAVELAYIPYNPFGGAHDEGTACYCAVIPAVRPEFVHELRRLVDDLR